MKSIPKYLLCLLSIIVLSSCDYRRETLDDITVWVKVKLDWTECGLSPNGASIYFYPSRKDLSSKYILTNETIDSTLLHRDYYHLIAFNETANDHYTIRYKGVENKNTMMAHTDTSAIFRGTHECPTKFAVGSIAEYEVTREMLTAQSAATLFINPCNALSRFKLNVRVQGLHNVNTNKSYATIDNFTEGIYLCDLRNSENNVTHALRYDSLKWDNDTVGVISANIECFGLSDNAEKHTLTLYLRLKDGSTYTTERSILSLITQDSSNRTISANVGFGDIDNPIIIVSDVIPTDPDDDKDSGFDADVDEWGDIINIDITI